MKQAPHTSSQVDLAFGRAMAEALFNLNLGPATPMRPPAMLLRQEDLAAICAGAFALGRSQPAPEPIPTGEATELPVETIYPGTLQ